MWMSRYCRMPSRWLRRAEEEGSVGSNADELNNVPGENVVKEDDTTRDEMLPRLWEEDDHKTLYEKLGVESPSTQLVLDHIKDFDDDRKAAWLNKYIPEWGISNYDDFARVFEQVCNKCQTKSALVLVRNLHRRKGTRPDPLFIAVRHNHVEFVRELLENQERYGVNIERGFMPLNEQPCNLLGVAVRQIKNGECTEMIELLLSMGVVVDDDVLIEALAAYGCMIPKRSIEYWKRDDEFYLKWSDHIFGWYYCKDSSFSGTWSNNEEMEHDFSQLKKILRYVCSGAAGNVNMDIKADCPLYAHLATRYRYCPIDMELLDLMEKAGFNMELAVRNIAINTFDEQRTIECINEIVDKGWYRPKCCFSHPLYFVCRFGCLEAAKHFIRTKGWYRPNCDCVALPLHFACRFGCLEAAKHLIRIGAEPFLTDEDNLTPFAYFLLEQSPNEEQLNVWLNAFGPDLSDDGFDLSKNVPKCTFGSALHLIFKIRPGNASCVRKLIGLGASVDDTDNDGNTPLHIACEVAGRKKVCNEEMGHRLLAISELLNHCPNLLDSKNQKGRTAFHIADHRDIIDRLVDANANVNAQDNNGDTKLHIYVDRYWDQLEMTKHLLEKRGLKPNVTNANGETPLLRATKTWHKGKGCREKFFDVCKLLLDKGANANITDQNGDCVLHCFCQKWFFHEDLGSVDRYLQLFLEHNADINHANKAHQTPLLTAWYQVRQLHDYEKEGKLDRIKVFFGSVNWAKVCNFLESLILEHGADPKIQDGNGNSLLHLLCQDCSRTSFPTEGLAQLIQLAMDKGCNPDQLNSEKETPIMIYARHHDANLDILFHMVLKVAAEYGSAPTILV